MTPSSEDENLTNEHVSVSVASCQKVEEDAEKETNKVINK